MGMGNAEVGMRNAECGYSPGIHHAEAGIPHCGSGNRTASHRGLQMLFININLLINFQSKIQVLKSELGTELRRNTVRTP